MTDVRVRRAGDRAVLLEVPDGTAARVAQRIGVELGRRLVDVVPGHRTVLVTWDSDPPQDSELTALAVGAIDGLDAAVAPRTVQIPVTYDGEDLASVAELVGMTVDEVVRAHTAPEYTAAFLGFQPGFAYLLGGDERLQVPRRDEPRQRVPGGSVAVAGPYSGVYPRDGPGGWQLLGTTTAVLFDPEARPPALISAGDRVRFVAS